MWSRSRARRAEGGGASAWVVGRVLVKPRRLRCMALAAPTTLGALPASTPHTCHGLQLVTGSLPAEGSGAASTTPRVPCEVAGAARRAAGAGADPCATLDSWVLNSSLAGRGEEESKSTFLLASTCIGRCIVGSAAHFGGGLCSRAVTQPMALKRTQAPRFRSVSRSLTR